MKPLGYFTSVTPGDGSTLNDLQTRYGSGLEHLTKAQKLLLLVRISRYLLDIETLMQGELVVADALEDAEAIACDVYSGVVAGDLPGLASALLHQLQHGCYRAPY